MSDNVTGLSMIVEPTKDPKIKVPHDLSAADLYRLLTDNGYLVLRGGWPDFFVVPPDSGPSFAVELKAGLNPLMHKALETAGIKILTSREIAQAAAAGRWGTR